MINNAVERERQLDANRAIAQKIRNRLQQLENATDVDKQRWIWELLQNAKDTVSVEDKVDIEIIITDKYLDFSHNGGFFTARNITNLVHQISSKEGTESTGRFGTGFLTTHTLSRLIQVESILFDEEKNEYSNFSILLSREGSKEEEFIEGIQKTWDSFTSRKIDKPQRCKTIFRYLSPHKEIALGALKNFEEAILFNLAFVEKLGKITIQNDIENNKVTFCLKDKKQLSKNICLYSFMAGDSERLLLKLSDNDIDICIEVSKKDNSYIFEPISENFARIFCDFPLIGTENFSFPLILNSRNFSPKTERDGLYLNGDGEFAINNKRLIEQATILYAKLLDFTTQNNFKDFHILAKHTLPPRNDDFDQSWYKTSIQTKIQNSLLEFPIIESENHDFLYLLKGTHYDGIHGVWFPYANEKRTREFIWDKTFALYPNALPSKKDINYWFDIVKNWSKCQYQKMDEIVGDIAHYKNIHALTEQLKKEEDKSLEWLNETCDFIQSEQVELLENHSVLPNQYGIFKIKSELYYDDNIPNEFKDILKLNDIDIREELLHKSLSTVDMKHRKKSIKTTIEEINKIITFPEQLRKNDDGSYDDEDYNKYTQEEYILKIQRVRSIVFTLLGYSSTDEIDKSHQKLWEFARTLYYDEIPETIEIIKNIESDGLHTESFKWLVIQMVKDIAKAENIQQLEEKLQGTKQPIEWLDNFISFIEKHEEFKHIIDLDEYIILPNQYGNFREKSELFLDDELDKNLKEVLREMNPDWIGELLDVGIYLKLPDNRVRKFEDIAREIDDSFRTYTNDKQNPTFIKAFRTLLSWTSKQSKTKFEENFNWIYSHKAELSLSILGDEKEKDEIFKIIESGKAPLLSKIANSSLTDSDLEELSENTEEFKKFIDLKKSGKSTLDEQELLNKLNAEFGENCSSVEEFKKKYKAKGTEITLTTPSGGDGSAKDVDWDAISQSNEEAKARVKEHLSNNSVYDITHWREESKTIIGGVKKKGIDITLVIKGANNGTVYFDKAGKEKRVLKNSFTELWVNNQGNVIPLTLGKFIEDQQIQVIKTTRI